MENDHFNDFRNYNLMLMLLANYGSFHIDAPYSKDSRWMISVGKAVLISGETISEAWDLLDEWFKNNEIPS